MILDEQRRYVSSLTEEISKRGAGIPGQQGQVSFPNTHVCRRWRLMEEEAWRKERLLCHMFLQNWVLLFFLQITQQELDTVVNTQHEILRQVNEMK